MAETPKPPVDQDPQQQLRAILGERISMQIGLLKEAAAVVGGPGALANEVFDEPPATRNDAPMPDWTEKQIDQERAIASRFGYGSEETIPSGLRGGTRKNEGGKVWKMLAEDDVVGAEVADTLVYSGSPDSTRRTLGKDEQAYLQEHQPELQALLPADATEYDFQALLAKRRANGVVFDEPVVLPFGYAISDGNPTVYEPTGQLVEVGKTSTGQSVQLLRVDQEDYKDEEGSSKFKYRPDSGKLMEFLADVLQAQGKPDDPVAVVTSGTYASREVDAMTAGVNHERPFGVVMYGRSVLTKLKAPVPADMPLNHLPGEFRLRHDKLQELAKILKLEPTIQVDLQLEGA